MPTHNNTWNTQHERALRYARPCSAWQEFGAVTCIYLTFCCKNFLWCRWRRWQQKHPLCVCKMNDKAQRATLHCQVWMAAGMAYFMSDSKAPLMYYQVCQVYDVVLQKSDRSFTCCIGHCLYTTSRRGNSQFRSTILKTLLLEWLLKGFYETRRFITFVKKLCWWKKKNICKVSALIWQMSLRGEVTRSQPHPSDFDREENGGDSSNSRMWHWVLAWSLLVLVNGR